MRNLCPEVIGGCDEYPEQQTLDVLRLMFIGIAKLGLRNVRARLPCLNLSDLHALTVLPDKYILHSAQDSLSGNQVHAIKGDLHQELARRSFQAENHIANAKTCEQWKQSSLCYFAAGNAESSAYALEQAIKMLPEYSRDRNKYIEERKNILLMKAATMRQENDEQTRLHCIKKILDIEKAAMRYSVMIGPSERPAALTSAFFQEYQSPLSSAASSTSTASPSSFRRNPYSLLCVVVPCTDEEEKCLARNLW
ncbi:MAG: hypothetical protein NTZ67_02135 [Gammaproteobacteria bacterium]|nr:hypothetical protein [Gammaproteobacteria bacterium]